MKLVRQRPPFAFQPVMALVAAGLLLLAGALAAGYQYHSARAERRRQLTVQANILAASVTAAIVFDDHTAAREYVDALKLDPRLDAAAVFGEGGHRVAGFRRPDSDPLPDGLALGERPPRDSLLVEVTAHQGTTTVGRVYLRGARTPLTVQVARYSGVALLTLMAVLMLAMLAVAQRTLARANLALQRRALQLADTNARLSEEMEQRSRTEEALRQSQKMEAIGQLSGGIAHDFNNLLMIIKGSLTRLQKGLRDSDAAVARLAEVVRECARLTAQGEIAGPLPVQPEDIRLLDQRTTQRRQFQHYLDMAQDGIDRAASLTRRLLTFARRQPLSPKALELDALIEGVRPLLDHSVGASVRIDYQLDAHWPVSCDPNQMESAILNLVINARDAMPDGGQITLRTTDVRVRDGQPIEDVPDGDYVHLQVIDNGTGMSEEVRNKAFDPFFTTKPVGKGTGLGLSTILGYVLQSQGSASIDSQPGRGTTINIVLPRAADPSNEVP